MHLQMSKWYPDLGLLHSHRLRKSQHPNQHVLSGIFWLCRRAQTEAHCETEAVPSERLPWEVSSEGGGSDPLEGHLIR